MHCAQHPVIRNCRVFRLLVSVHLAILQVTRPASTPLWTGKHVSALKRQLRIPADVSTKKDAQNVIHLDKAKPFS
jgi:hypothetical protein